jgi:DTW domain-containing protein YfiP
MRDFCLRCRKAKVTCYCAHLRPFEAGPVFVVLVHPREWKNSVGTGRMLHLSVSNSLLLQGCEFAGDERVNRLIADPGYHATVLYPGRDSIDLSGHQADAQVTGIVPAGKKLLVFVIDGTWDQARSMINKSPNLKALPQFRFTPDTRSIYRIREQPRDYCFSTLEAVHWMIERFDRLGVYRAPAGRAHQSLLAVFDHMVRQQLAYAAGKERRTAGVRVTASVPSV